ncbi:MAG TPA: orotate phosphoribosyltransferase [Candidatus Syntrophosphaera thermopropionivorans]|nr:orotate phosphoribosyltransferase [Candidatus Syntrophosphaera thermopropionivorans]
MEDNLVTIAKFEDNFEADLAQRLLADNGIQAFVKNAIFYSMMPGVFPGKVDLELQVNSEDEEKARAILSEYQNTPEIKRILVRNDVLQEGHFLLTSGRHSANYLEKIHLYQNPQDTTRVCEMLAELLVDYDFDTVVGPAYGGIVLAFETARMLEKGFLFTQRKEGVMTIRSGFDLSKVKKVVITEDIITTGGSVKEVITTLKNAGIEVVAVAAIVDRSTEEMDFGCPFLPLLKMDIPSWEADDCVLCQNEIPLTIPGSSDKKI